VGWMKRHVSLCGVALSSGCQNIWHRGFSFVFVIETRYKKSWNPIVPQLEWSEWNQEFCFIFVFCVVR
jgi:hypothetical protein